MEDNRPNPDQLLAQAKASEPGQRRGKLKIFFGASAGVGKTYTMLEAARIRQREGVDVVAGYVEPHGRKETESLLEGIEQIPFRWVEYKNVKLREFDLDAALARKPQLILVDELAHTNAEGSGAMTRDAMTRHAKRWQDVQELLDAGIDVYTTVNVQHLESQNDVVAQITGEIQRETVPDSVFEQADEVELIDLPADELLKRLGEGKIYRPQQAQLASQKFFRKGNLNALREIALRRTAERVDAQMQAYQRERAIEQVWPAAERILVCISPSLLSQKLVRAAKRMATGLHADWVVAYVETTDSARLPEAKRESVDRTLRLAEELGADTVTLNGDDISVEVLAYARGHNISKIVVGKPQKPRWREVLFGSTVDKLVRESGVIDVYVIHGEHDDTEPHGAMNYLRAPERSPASAYAWSALIIAACTFACWVAFSASHIFDLANLIMIYLLGVVIVAMGFGRGPSVMASLLGVVLFDFLFVPPQFTFAVEDTRYVATFAVMLLTGLVISNLTVRTRLQAAAAHDRERRTRELYDMSRALASTRGLDTLASISMKHIADVFDAQVAVVLPDVNGRLEIKRLEIGDSRFESGQPPISNRQSPNLQSLVLNERELSVAQWVYEHNEPAGQGTRTLASSQALHLPLRGARGVVGVLAVNLPAQQHPQSNNVERMRALETFANQTALALERAKLAEEAGRARARSEVEQTRSNLLSAVSHDLRTPLAAITGAASSLLDNETTFAPETRRELTQSIYSEAERLNRLVGNLLEMTKLQSGTVTAHKDWQSVEEVIGAALVRLDKALQGREVKVGVPADLPLVPLDAVMIEQVLVNLIENALKYTPPGSPIEVNAWPMSRREWDGVNEAVGIEVADRGPGLKPGDEQRVFEKFYRAHQADNSGAAPNGTGLGLAIAKGVLAAHGGRIWAENRVGGGASFKFALPMEGEMPRVEIRD